MHQWEGGDLENTYELLNLITFEISTLYKNRIFQCMGEIFCVQFQRFPLDPTENQRDLTLTYRV